MAKKLAYLILSSLSCFGCASMPRNYSNHSIKSAEPALSYLEKNYLGSFWSKDSSSSIKGLNDANASIERPSEYSLDGKVDDLYGIERLRDYENYRDFQKTQNNQTEKVKEGGPRRFSIGLLGGGAFNMASEAIEGFQDTEFEDAFAYGASLQYRFKNGTGFEIVTERLSSELVENGESFGDLEMSPLMLLFKIQGWPKEDKGLTGHFDIGGGINFTNFEKGSFVKNLERETGTKISIDTDDSFVFELGGGADYFFNRRISLNLDGRLLLGGVGTDWTISGPAGSIDVSPIEEFDASNFQILLGLKIWF